MAAATRAGLTGNSEGRPSDGRDDDARGGARAAQRRSDVVGPGAFRALYENCPDGVLFTVPNGEVLAANPAACEILQMSEDEICARGRAGLADTGDPRWLSLLDERRRTGRASGIARMKRGDGRLIEVEMSSSVFTEPDAGSRTCTVIRDVTDRVAMEADLRQLTQRLRELSMRDPLTGLHNRRGLLAFGMQLLRLADRTGDPVQVLFVDVNGMKALNDDLGHQAGDAGLRAVARALTGVFRATDVVARVGGDEFVVVALGHVDQTAVEQRLRRQLARPEVSASVGRSLSLSLGSMTRRPGQASSLDALVAEADRAMYACRALRRGDLAPPFPPRDDVG